MTTCLMALYSDSQVSPYLKHPAFVVIIQHFTARCYAFAVLAMGLCQSVCLSVTSRSSTKTAKRSITQTTPHNSPGTLTPKISAKFDQGHPLQGRQMQVGWVKISDFRQISGYILKTAKNRHIVSIKVE